MLENLGADKSLKLKGKWSRGGVYRLGPDAWGTVAATPVLPTKPPDPQHKWWPSGMHGRGAAYLHATRQLPLEARPDTARDSLERFTRLLGKCPLLLNKSIRRKVARPDRRPRSCCSARQGPHPPPCPGGRPASARRTTVREALVPPCLGENGSPKNLGGLFKVTLHFGDKAQRRPRREEASPPRNAT